ncbi:aldehyde dehydrogenase [Novosphingobium rosa]|uniref:aldehyde dehydrogenase n=1 Tax=Novosphingobium rosa TaxID=76978 RepID=UPI00082A4237|nr:aldehyde dehydrogenase [Novosphingobium rosa]
MKKYQMFIGGEFVDAAGGATLETLEPWSGKAWASIPRGGSDDATRAVEVAHAALTGPWAGLSASARGALLRKLADLLAHAAGDLAEIEVRDNGKLLTEMRAQTGYLPEIYHYFAGLADKIEGRVPPVGRPGVFGYTRLEPVGVVLAITPWNSPLLLAAAKIAPALAAGCTVVHKPSEHSSASALEFARLVKEAGFPDGVFNVVTGLGNEVGASLVANPKVARISFTGGGGAGRAINQIAAARFARCDLELGGKSPNIVFDDADLEVAVNGAVSGIFAASGQSCIAGSRLLVQESIHDAFVERLLKIAGNAVVGEPMEAGTQIGPVTTAEQFSKVLEYIDIAKGEGAQCVLGGEKLDRPGWFVKPTIFTGVNNGMRIAREEVFGPILSIIKFKDEEDALRIANDTDFGLAAGVWTKDFGRAFRMSEKLQAGTVWVNSYRMLSVTMPFGGMKDSGTGRENGIDAIMANLEAKSVFLNHSAPVANPFVMKL